MSENTKQAAPFDAEYQAAVEQNIPCRVCGRVYAEHIRVGATNPGWCNAYTPPMSNPPSHPSADAREAAKELDAAWRLLNDVIRSASAFLPLDLCNELEGACARMDAARLAALSTPGDANGQ